jgi:hypothetical protein
MLVGSQLLLKRGAGRYHLVSGKESPWKKGFRQGGQSKSLKGAFGKKALAKRLWLWSKDSRRTFGKKVARNSLEKRHP